MTSIPLTIELNPKTCFIENIKSHVSKEEWDVIRKRVYSDAGHRCEICNGRGPRWPVECHEHWDYNDLNRTKTLVKMVALCPACHRAKHIARYASFGQLADVMRHVEMVNRWSEKESEVYLKRQVELWKERSEHRWKVNLDVLQDYFLEQIKEAEHKPIIGEVEW